MIWHLGIAYLNPEDVLDGPSLECLGNLPFCIRNGILFYDDVLNLEDIDIVIGLYWVLTGMYMQLPKRCLLIII